MCVRSETGALLQQVINMKSVKACPKCNRVLEPVENKDGELLGHFCLNVLNKACDFIDCISSEELKYSKSEIKNK